MSIPDTITSYLHAHDIAYDVVSHPRTSHSSATAHAAHLPGTRVAKAIVMEDGERYVLVVIPATHRLDPVALRRFLRREAWFVDEADLPLLFRDCRPGAVPALGAAYGIDTVLDDEMTEPPDVYLEAGDHEHLIRLDHSTFARAFERAERGRISYHA